MASILSLAALLARVTKEQIIEKGLAVATAVGLPVTSWSPGDPTRSLYLYSGEILETLEDVVADYVAAGFLEFAEKAWLTLLAKQVFNVDAIDATYATVDIVLTNGGGGSYELQAGDLTVKNTAANKTYRNVSGGTLPPGPGTTLTLTVIADEAGSDSSALPNEIDGLVTTLLGVTVTNPLAAIGLDAESALRLKSRCRSKTGALSPNGPRDAYVHIALTPEFTGTTNVTRARSVGDSTTGDVNLYIASPSGPVSSTDRDAVEAAVLKWSTPLCFTPHVNNTVAAIVDVTYTYWVYTGIKEEAAAITAKVDKALRNMAVERPIGGDVIAPAAGKLYKSMIQSTIFGTYPEFAVRADVTLPASDTALAVDAVPVIGLVTGTIVFVRDP